MFTASLMPINSPLRSGDFSPRVGVRLVDRMGKFWVSWTLWTSLRQCLSLGGAEGCGWVRNASGYQTDSLETRCLGLGLLPGWRGRTPAQGLGPWGVTGPDPVPGATPGHQPTLGRPPTSLCHSPAAAESPGLGETDFSVLQFQETVNANLCLLRGLFEKMERVVLRRGSSGAGR